MLLSFNINKLNTFYLKNKISFVSKIIKNKKFNLESNKSLNKNYKIKDKDSNKNMLKHIDQNKFNLNIYDLEKDLIIEENFNNEKLNKDFNYKIITNNYLYNNNEFSNDYDKNFDNKKYECVGCGVITQIEYENKIGYIPKEKFYELINNDNEIICDRCHKLKNYGRFEVITKKQRLEEEINALKNLSLSNQVDNSFEIENVYLKNKNKLKLSTYKEFIKNKSHYYSILEKIDISKLISLVSNRLSKYSQVFYILDVTDIDSSINVNVLNMLNLKKCGLTFIINKFDTLPQTTSYERINIYCGEKLKTIMTDNNILDLKYSYVVLSAKNGYKYEYILSKIKQMKNYYKENNIYYGKPKIYIIGNCNVGKSTFINKMIDKINTSKGNEKDRLDKKKLNNYNYIAEISKEVDKSLRYINNQSIEIDKITEEQKENTKKESEKEVDFIDNLVKESNNIFNKQQDYNNIDIDSKDTNKKEHNLLTCSIVPGTTLDIRKINNLKYGCVFYDTPGFPNNNSIINKLNNNIDALTAVCIKNRIKTHILNFKQGYTLFVGGLVRIDLINGEDKFISLFFSDQVTIHKTQTLNADYIWENRRGILLRPYIKEDDNPKFKDEKEEYSTLNFNLNCDKFRTLNYDIVINGLGWFSISGKGFCQIEVTLPKNVSCFLRDKVLLPYEPRTKKLEKLYGKTINVKSKKNKDIFDSFNKLNNKNI